MNSPEIAGIALQAMLFEFYSPSECLLEDAALLRFLPSVDETVLL
jgi:hypothetical protein